MWNILTVCCIKYMCTDPNVVRAKTTLLMNAADYLHKAVKITLTSSQQHNRTAENSQEDSGNRRPEKRQKASITHPHTLDRRQIGGRNTLTHSPHQSCVLVTLCLGGSWLHHQQHGAHEAGGGPGGLTEGSITANGRWSTAATQRRRSHKHSSAQNCFTM